MKSRRVPAFPTVCSYELSARLPQNVGKHPSRPEIRTVFIPWPGAIFMVGVTKDFAAAFRYWLDAAKAGIPESQSEVADCLLKELGTPVDLEMAAQWCRLALRNGVASEAELLRQVESANVSSP